MRVEDDQVCARAAFDSPMTAKPESLGGESRHLAHGLFEREYSQFARVVSEDARIGPISARMRLAAEQTVGADVNVWLAHDLAHDFFGLAERDHPDAHSLRQQEIEGEFSRFLLCRLINPFAQTRRLREVLTEALRVIARRNVRDHYAFRPR